MLTTADQKRTWSSFGEHRQRNRSYVRSSNSSSWKPPSAISQFIALGLLMTLLGSCIVSTGCAFKVMTGPSSVELDILPCAPSVSVSLAGAAVASPACPMERTSLTFGTSLKNEPESLK